MSDDPGARLRMTPRVYHTGGGKGMARVGSLGKLDASGGSAAQLLGRCAAKAVTLGVVVFLTTAVTLPRIVLEAVYGAQRPCLTLVSCHLPTTPALAGDPFA